MEREIITLAIDNFQKNTGLNARVKKASAGNHHENTVVEIDFGIEKEIFNLECKKNFAPVNLAYLDDLNKPVMVIAEIITPKIKKQLRELKIAYIETVGNAYLKTKKHMIFLDGFKQVVNPEKFKNRAFTKTGLKLVYQYLLNPDLINIPYREVAKQADVALDTINKTFYALKALGFIIMINKKDCKITNRKELFERWITEYETRLKPYLEIGTFRFVQSEDFRRWREMKFDNSDTLWGAEPAAGLLTNYLHPEILTIYTTENRNDLMRKYRLVPDIKGNVKIYHKFWINDFNNKFNVVHPELIYADLLNTADTRNIETAKMIFNEFIENKYK